MTMLLYVKKYSKLPLAVILTLGLATTCIPSLTLAAEGTDSLSALNAAASALTNVSTAVNAVAPAAAPIVKPSVEKLTQSVTQVSATAAAVQTPSLSNTTAHVDTHVENATVHASTDTETKSSARTTSPLITYPATIVPGVVTEVPTPAPPAADLSADASTDTTIDSSKIALAPILPGIFGAMVVQGGANYLKTRGDALFSTPSEVYQNGMLAKKQTAALLGLSGVLSVLGGILYLYGKPRAIAHIARTFVTQMSA